VRWGHKAARWPEFNTHYSSFRYPATGLLSSSRTAALADLSRASHCSDVRHTRFPIRLPVTSSYRHTLALLPEPVGIADGVTAGSSAFCAPCASCAATGAEDSTPVIRTASGSQYTCPRDRGLRAANSGRRLEPSELRCISVPLQSLENRNGRARRNRQCDQNTDHPESARAPRIDARRIQRTEARCTALHDIIRSAKGFANHGPHALAPGLHIERDGQSACVRFERDCSMPHVRGKQREMTGSWLNQATRGQVELQAFHRLSELKPSRS